MGCDNGCGCSGCEKKPNEQKKDGRSLAHGAIDEIKCRSCRGHSQDSIKLSESVDSFLAECAENDVDPLQVVAQVAANEGVMIGAPAPEDSGKRWVYDILRAVVKRVNKALLDRLDSLAEDCGIGMDDIACLSECGQDEPCQAISVIVAPILIRYV